MTDLAAASTSTTFNGITLGTVVDNNDPQQMGRVRAYCPALGDTPTRQIKEIPWASYSSPLAGMSSEYQRGREGTTSTTGNVGYGMWNIPKVGAQVLIMCLDGNPSFRVYMGCLYDQYHTNTFPHGRYFGLVDGPHSASEQPIQPLSDNQTEAFQDKNSYEFRSRGADFTASGLQPSFIGTRYNKSTSKADDKNVNVTGSDGKTFDVTQGYAESQMKGAGENSQTGKSYDSTVYSWTTPGFHAISMDDRQENCRMRFRTVGGHQIILDDTNERIYISTAKGKTWIEIDEQGTIDIYSEQDFSVRSGGDINFTAEKSFRVSAKTGIHLVCTEGTTRIHSFGDIDFKSTAMMRFESDTSMKLQSHTDIHLKSSTDMFFTSGTVLNILSGSDTRMSAGGSNHITASGQVVVNGEQIHFNGPAGTPASNANPAEAKESFWTSRVPNHEPWARVYMNLSADLDAGNSHVPEFEYDSPMVGSGSNVRGVMFIRNKNWRR